jgi:hypothetical protein
MMEGNRRTEPPFFEQREFRGNLQNGVVESKEQA